MPAPPARASPIARATAPRLLYFETRLKLHSEYVSKFTQKTNLARLYSSPLESPLPAHGVAHRDLKPDNLLLKKRRSNRLVMGEECFDIKIADFGECLDSNRSLGAIDEGRT